MIIFPAIDLYQGKAVRLYKGRYEDMTVYSDRPVQVARYFDSCGARWLHMVDLEGARDGATPNLSIIRQAAAETGLKVEAGGGVRSMETVEAYMEAGVSRVILGTAAVEDRSLLLAAVAKYGDKIAVGADLRDGMVAVRGWRETSGYTADGFLKLLRDIGVKNVICTDISRDGAMRGANLELYARLKRDYALDITASGGVSSLEDVRALRDMGLYGAIIGKAYYSGAIELKEALEAAR